MQSKSKKPLWIMLMSVLLFLGLIAQHQWHLAHSRSVFIALQPVDPRSLLQGDYMQLRYDLAWRNINAQQLQKSPKIMAYVQLDAQQRLLHSQLLAAPNLQPLQLKNPMQQIDQLYPATTSFFFAEGLADCYAQAKYAHFQVNAKGVALLVGLRDAQLQDLACEKKPAEGQV